MTPMKKKMKKYTFRYHSDNWVDVTVAAEDQETARILADNRYNNGEYDDSDTDFENTHCDLLSEEAVEEDSPAQERKVHTCFGVFTIRGNVAFPADAETEDEFGDEVVLPKPDMTNDEIKDYFRLLEEERKEEHESAGKEKLAIIDHNTHTLYIDEVDEELINSKYEGEEEKYIDDVYGFDNYSWDYVVSVKNNQ